MNIVILNNIVNDTSSNSEGEKLFNVLESSIKQNQEVVLNIGPEEALSSSFLNSSIGRILELYGLDKFKSLFKFKGSLNQFERLSKYIKHYSEAHIS